MEFLDRLVLKHRNAKLDVRFGVFVAGLRVLVPATETETEDSCIPKI